MLKSPQTLRMLAIVLTVIGLALGLIPLLTVKDIPQGMAPFWIATGFIFCLAAIFLTRAKSLTKHVDSD